MPCSSKPYNHPTPLTHTNLDSHQPNQVIISSTYSLEHNTDNELIVVIHEINLDMHLMLYH